MTAPRPRRRRRVVLGLLALALVLLVAGLAWALRAAGILFVDRLPVRFALPRPAGPHAVGVVELHLVDAGRRDPWVAGRPRELMASVWYPAVPGAGGEPAPYMRPGAARAFAEAMLGPVRLADRVDFAAVRTHARVAAPALAPDSAGWPVVLFSPGGSMPRTLGTALVEDLASRGYVVVTMDHTHEAAAVEFPDGRVALRTLREGESILRPLVAARVADTRFVLDRLAALRRGDGPALPPGLAAALDLSRVGMFGHSAGGFTAVETMLVDRRLDAVANLDGSMAYRMSRGEYGDAVGRGLDRPLLLMGAGTSGGPTTPHTHRHSPTWGALWRNSTGWKRDVHVPEGEHFTFTDVQVAVPQLRAKLFLPRVVTAPAVGTVDGARAVAATRAYLAAFFDLHLKGLPQPLLDGPSPDFPDVDFIR